nr:MAG TPA: hypothetical protein [Bacteriophage sp.]
MFEWISNILKIFLIVYTIIKIIVSLHFLFTASIVTISRTTLTVSRYVVYTGFFPVLSLFRHR